MKKVTYFCDKCGAEITEVVYELNCWAEDLTGDACNEVSRHNMAQNMVKQKYTRHLCKTCKDELTDGLFIV